MLEVRYRTARALPLGRAAGKPQGQAETAGVAIRPAGAEARFVLRVRSAPGEAAGLPLDRPINTLSGDGCRFSCVTCARSARSMPVCAGRG